MTQDLDKKRHEAHFLPEIDKELRLIAQQDNRSVKGLLEWLALEYIKKRTGKKLLNKIKSKTR